MRHLSMAASLVRAKAEELAIMSMAPAMKARLANDRLKERRRRVDAGPQDRMGSSPSQYEFVQFGKPSEILVSRTDQFAGAMQFSFLSGNGPGQSSTIAARPTT
jgi:hypothetical protein